MLTAQQFIETAAKLKAHRVKNTTLVGAVCRPDYYTLIKECFVGPSVEDAEIKGQPPRYYGVPLYKKAQKTEVLFFWDTAELDHYLALSE